MERSKKKVQVWQKAIVHFLLCFVMGFFSGFAPTGKSSMVSNRHAAVPEKEMTLNRTLSEGRSGLVILVTAVRSSGGELAWLDRMAQTVRVGGSAGLLWIVVEAGKAETPEVAALLRRTGVMYRHLVMNKDVQFKSSININININDTTRQRQGQGQEEEEEEQWNLALGHIEQHRLTGIVHLAALNNVYHRHFFNHLREIEVFGTWPMAILSPNRSRVIIQGGPSSQLVAWHLNNHNHNHNHNHTDKLPIPIHISAFAFNSSILWDPERWGRPSSDHHLSKQNSINFVKQVVLEDEAKVKEMPLEDCSRILLWHLKPQIGSSSPLSTYLPVAAISGEDEDK